MAALPVDGGTLLCTHYPLQLHADKKVLSSSKFHLLKDGTRNCVKPPVPSLNEARPGH